MIQNNNNMKKKKMIQIKNNNPYYIFIQKMLLYLVNIKELNLLNHNLKICHKHQISSNRCFKMLNK